ncbi:MAG: DUF5693 family protein [Candidatus Muirbacterium halophilum]|nr:DUF5693 family protein [Candidatus Muirbacterium halophilum]
MKFKKTINTLRALIIIIGLIFSAYILSERHFSEKKHNKYEVCVRFKDVIDYGKSDFFENVVKYNFNDYISVIELSPKTCQDLEMEGKLLASTGIEIKNYINIQAVISPYIPEILREAGIIDEYTYIYSENKELLEYIDERIKIENNSVFSEITTKKIGFRKNEKNFYMLVTDFSKKAIHNMYIEFDEEFIQYLRLSEFRIAFDLSVIKSERQLDFLKRHILLPEYVITHNINNELNNYLLLKNIKKVDFEFSKYSIPFPFLRGHLLEEDFNLNEDDYIRRIRKAVIERKISFLKYEFNEDFSKEKNFDLLKKISNNLHKFGFDKGYLDYFSMFKIKDILLFQTIILFSIVFFVFYSFRILIKKDSLSIFIFELLTGLVLALYFYKFSGNISFVLAVSFLISVIIPVTSLNLLKTGNNSNIKKYINTVFNNITELLSYNLTGVMLILPLFYKELFIQGQMQFRGVKLSLVLPVLILFIYIIKSTGVRISDILEKEIKFKHVIGFSIFLFISFYYVLRSSNAGADFMLPLEKKIRIFLEDYFIIRPRTKEFFMFYPALLFFSNKKFLSKKSISYFLLLFAILVGQTSIFNTFMHFHIPLQVSIIRTITGLILGVITGIILLLLNDWIKFFIFYYKKTEK